MVKIKILVTLTQITFWPRILNYSINLADRFTNVARYAFISRISWRYARWMWFAVRTLLWTFDAEVSDCCRYLSYHPIRLKNLHIWLLFSGPSDHVVGTASLWYVSRPLLMAAYQRSPTTGSRHWTNRFPQSTRWGHRPRRIIGR